MAHRPTLKQVNKKFKGSSKPKHKGETKKHQKPAKEQTKRDRLNAAKNQRMKKSSLMRETLRKFSGNDGASRIVMLYNATDSIHDLDALFSGQFEQNVVFLRPTGIDGLLEAALYSDLLVFCGEGEMTAEAEHFIALLKAYRVPKIAVCGSSLQRLMQHHFSQECPIVDANDCKKLELVAYSQPRSCAWRDARPWMLAKTVRVEGDCVVIGGNMRGCAMSANLLAFIPKFGEFQIEKIVSKGVVQVFEDGQDLVQKNEVMEEEIEQDFEETAVEEEATVRVPKGTNAYHAAWFKQEDAESMDESENAMDESGSESDASSDSDLSEMIVPETREKMEDISDDEEERAKYLAQKRLESDEREFPDEIELPDDISAKERLQKYRGLDGFRHAHWDYMENLPLDYKRIFTLEDYKSAENVAKKIPSPFQVLDYAEVYIRAPKEVYEYYMNRTLFLHQLLPFEQKYSVVNFSVQKTTDSLVQAKEPLTALIGFRRYTVEPIYSDAVPGKVLHRTFKFMSDGCVASCYLPITFDAPVLLFRGTELVAYGQIIDCTPNRLNIKRVALCGQIFKVNRRTCVVRYMFSRVDDIHWFKRVQVATKSKRGQIVESLGTHGYMKCLFEGPVTQAETCHMFLYKRQFPKWGVPLLQ